MATYEELEAWIKNEHRFTPRRCWIAHVKSLVGIANSRVRNADRKVPCPDERRDAIKAALKHFKMLRGS